MCARAQAVDAEQVIQQWPEERVGEADRYPSERGARITLVEQGMARADHCQGKMRGECKQGIVQ